MEAASLPWDNMRSYAKAEGCTICDQDGQDNQRLHKCAAKHEYYVEPLHAGATGRGLAAAASPHTPQQLSETREKPSRAELSIPLVNTG